MGVAAVVVGIGGGRGDCAADDGGADEARADAPAGMEAVSLGRRGGASEAAGSDKGGDSNGGNLGLDGHGELVSVRGGPLWPACTPWTERAPNRFAFTAVKFWQCQIFLLTQAVRGLSVSGARSLRQQAHVEFIDVLEQFDERARAVLDQALALLRRCLGRIADSTAWMKILCLPCKRRRAMRGEPAILLFHRDARGRKIGDLVLAHMLGKSRQ